MPAQVHANLAVVIDTNIVLDMFVFSDPRCAVLHAALNARHLHWIATQVMRDELERVLDYSHLQGRMDFYKTTKLLVLAAFDARAKLQDIATRCV